MHRRANLLALLPFLGWVWLCSASPGWSAPPAAPDTRFTNAVVLSIANQVEFRSYGSQDWHPAYVQPSHLLLKPGDRLRTGPNSRALLRLSNLTDFPVGELTTLEIPRAESPRGIVRLLKGILYFFHRDKPGEFRVDTPTVSAVVRGTEFTVEVADNGDTKFQVLDGELEMTNDFGGLNLRRGEEGTATAGHPPRKTAVITTSMANVVQWCLYYPGVLNLDELRLPADAQSALAQSLSAYRAGALPEAVALYPARRVPASPDEKVYRAALLLAVGEVDEALSLLDSATAGAPARLSEVENLAAALKLAIAAVKRQAGQPGSEHRFDTNSATAWLADSYAEQSQFRLAAALAAARRATEIAPNFAFAWAQVAELEFGFGRAGEAQAALDRSLALSPRNAQALALKGFLLVARHQTAKAEHYFDEAILADGLLGNGWLGRGLCRIRGGDARAGVLDLMVAATLEPQRALFRSYLGKAFANAGDLQNAARELSLAKELDPNDPTAWLYSALLDEEEHRFNEGIRNLEKSSELNDNRRVYRSRLLLDQDRSVRSSSLAAIYRENGMVELSAREAAVAVTDSYANYDAHLFLANSLNALRDPTRFNLRYETAWFNELLLANLLSPVSAGTFAQSISQQEYSQFFNLKTMGLTTSTEARTDGQVREVATQFGNFKDFSYSFDVDYQHNNGTRPNNELDRLEWYSQFKFQITPADTVFLLTKYQDYHSGDNFQYYDWHGSVRTNFTYDEYQKPIVVGGYHHEWQPGIHTLVLGGRLVNDQTVQDKAVPEILVTAISNRVVGAGTELFDVNYHSQAEIYTAELNQIFQSEHQTLVFGGRFQTGQFETSNELNVTDPSLARTYYRSPAAAANVTSDFERITGYAYYTLEPLDRLFLTAGLSYDQVEYPDNFRLPPVSPGQNTTDLLGPKGAVVYNPWDWLTLRGAYSQSLGGVSLDQSYRLEPTQLAGFIQTYRSVIPESVVGSVSAPEFENYGAALDLKFKTGTYFGVQAQSLNSSVSQEAGAFRFDVPNRPILPASTRQNLDFDEQSISVYFNQLLGNMWSVGGSYQFISSELNSQFADIPVSVLKNANDTARSDLHHVGAFIRFSHPSGFFAAAEANWYLQGNTLQTHTAGSVPVTLDAPGDNFTQFNLFIGWRFPRQRGDLTLGVLNVGGSDYHLSPLNSYAELPHERVFAATLRLRF